LIDQLRGDFPDVFPVSSEGRQGVVVKSAEMIGQRFDQYSAVDAFFVDDGAKPNDLASVRVLPLVGEKFDIRVVLP
jgi:hypothetical protein